MSAERRARRDVAPSVADEERARRVELVLGDRLVVQRESGLSAVARPGDLGECGHMYVASIRAPLGAEQLRRGAGERARSRPSPR